MPIRLGQSAVRDWLHVHSSGSLDMAGGKSTDGRLRQRSDIEQVFDALPSGLFVVEADGVLSRVNIEAERIFGYSRAQWIGQPFSAVMGPIALPASHEGEAATHTAEILGIRDDASSIPIEVTFLPLRAGAMLVVVSDISARREAEAALKSKSEELQRSNADLEQFAYVASHDLQEPLRMVASYTQLLADRYAGQLDESADRYIGYAVEGAKRMQDLVRDLLSYSRMTASPRPIEDVDMNALVAGVLKVMGEALAATHANVCIEALPDVVGDSAQLHHVFLNGISNALKFRGTDAPRVRISGSTRGEMANFCIEDDGIGLDPRHAGRIFQMFQRLHERGKYEGSGIGLAIVKKVVERHGGRVWMESELGCGARLHFTLPKAAPR